MTFLLLVCCFSFCHLCYLKLLALPRKLNLWELIIGWVVRFIDKPKKSDFLKTDLTFRQLTEKPEKNDKNVLANIEAKWQ